MKTSRNILTVLIATGTPSVGLLVLSDRLPADLALASFTAIGLVAFAIIDYSRNTASLTVRAPVLRPTLLVATDADSRVTRKVA